MKHPTFGAIALFVLLAQLIPTKYATADGTETLGQTYSEDGSSMLIGGTGAKGVPSPGAGEFEIDVPAGVAIKQVYLYWVGRQGERI